MRLPKILTYTAVAIIALSLTGCVNDGHVTGNTYNVKDDINMEVFPEWNQQVGDSLEKEGFSVQDYSKDLEGIPRSFSALKGNCTITAAIRYEPVKMGTTQEAFTQTALEAIAGTESKPLPAIVVPFSDGNKAEFTVNSFTRPNITLPADFDSSVFATEDDLIEDGNFKGVVAMRVFNTEFENDAALEGTKGNPIASVTYECLNEDYDVALWDTVVNKLLLDATVKN